MSAAKLLSAWFTAFPQFFPNTEADRPWKTIVSSSWYDSAERPKRRAHVEQVHGMAVDFSVLRSVHCVSTERPSATGMFGRFVCVLVGWLAVVLVQMFCSDDVVGLFVLCWYLLAACSGSYMSVVLLGMSLSFLGWPLTARSAQNDLLSENHAHRETSWIDIRRPVRCRKGRIKDSEWGGRPHGESSHW